MRIVLLPDGAAPADLLGVPGEVRLPLPSSVSRRRRRYAGRPARTRPCRRGWTSGGAEAGGSGTADGVVVSSAEEKEAREEDEEERLPAPGPGSGSGRR